MHIDNYPERICAQGQVKEGNCMQTMRFFGKITISINKQHAMCYNTLIRRLIWDTMILDF